MPTEFLPAPPDSFCEAELPGRYEPCLRPAATLDERGRPVCLLHSPDFQRESLRRGFSVRPDRAPGARTGPRA